VHKCRQAANYHLIKLLLWVNLPLNTKFTNTVNMRLLCTFCHLTPATSSTRKKRNILDLLSCKFCRLRPNCRPLKIIIVWDDSKWTDTNVLTFSCNLWGRKMSNVPDSAAFRKTEENHKLRFCCSYLLLVHSQPLYNELLLPMRLILLAWTWI
jgi:transcription elongation factor Elf1